MQADTPEDHGQKGTAERRLTVRYDAAEDRLVVLLTRADASQRVGTALGLTRRLWLGLRRNLQAMLDQSVTLPPTMDPAVRQVVSTAHHRSLAATVPIRSEKASPSPDDPPVDLVIGVRCGRRRTDRRWVLTFKFRSKPDFPLVVNDLGLHALASALFRREGVTGWNLPALPASTAAGDQTESSHALH